MAGKPEMTGNLEVVVHGVKETIAAFEDVKVRVDPATGKALTAAAVPIRKTAEELAVEKIANIGPQWSRFKVGRKRTGVYIAERQKRSSQGSPRPNLSNLLMSRALIPAFQLHEAEALIAVREVIDTLCKEAERI
jgi:hypothetical protein